MKELKIYQFQAEAIENALRIAANVLESHNKETCLDRQIMQSLEYIRNAIAEKPDERVPYM